MRHISRIHIVVELVLIVAISPCSSAQTTQPQGPVKEPQKATQPVNDVDELNRKLIAAVMQGQEERVRELVSQGADINPRIGPRTILHMTVINGNDKSVLLLLNNGALVDARDEDGCTPLHVAAGAGFPGRNRSPNMIKALLDKGADINAQDRFGLTPLHHATAGGNQEIVVMLLEHSASVDIKDNAGRTPLHYASGSMQRSNEMVIEKPFIEIVKLLLDNGANIDAQDNIGWTPVRYAVSKGNQDVAIKQTTGRTPYKSIVELLIAKGADLSIIDYRGHTAYSWNREKASFQANHSLTNNFSRYVNEYNETAKLLCANGGVYFVAPNGKDSNPGTIDQPFKNITAALGMVGPGDKIFVRGGTYHCERSIRLHKSGVQGNPIYLRAYPGEVPILDFTDVGSDSLYVSGAYWHIKGLSVINSYYGVMVFGPAAHHNILEQMTACHNGWGGILLRNGPAYNAILNCDAYHNFDVEFNGDTCDGFSIAYLVGKGNVFIGSRSWNNSDDGYDCWRAGEAVRFERCYAWKNGENIWNHPFFFGNGNGYKLGPDEGRHVLVNCVTWGHSYIGYNLNGNTDGVILRNCSAWGNGTNYAFNWRDFSDEGRKNCVFINNMSYDGRRSEAIHTEARSQNNSWNSELNIALTDDDFLSLDDSQMSAPRNPDGSIPYNNFLRLAPGSAAIDKGIDVGMPFVGVRPDLGAFEYDPNETSEGYVKMLHQAVRDHDVKQIEQLLAQGEGINEKDWLGYTPLHWAVYFGYPDLVELLISKGADPNIQSDTGRYALEIARAMAYPELEALLRKLGAKAGDTSAN
ncbi:MAG TPA: ankyrin repeat domain-containing protein [Sedimentisphaerales bacterium]|nr:ankyrin repeat domain-containing protein [Sedimentisphaerales bacterium]